MTTEIQENILGAGGDPSIDIENPETKARVNALLGQALETSFLTPYMGIERISNVLAKFHIPIPKSTFLEGDHGYKVFEVNQFGTKFGMNDQGEVVQKDGCSCSIYFEYQLNDSGEFDIFAEIVSEEELDEILDDVEDEEESMNEEAVMEAKLSPEEIKALRTAMKHLRVTVKKAVTKKKPKMTAIPPPKRVASPAKKDSIKRIVAKAAKIKKSTKPKKKPVEKKAALKKKPSPAAIVKAVAAVKKKKPAEKNAAPKKKPRKVLVRKATVKSTPVAAKPKPKIKNKAKPSSPKAQVKNTKLKIKTKTKTKKKITEPKKKTAIAKAAIKKVTAKKKAPMIPKPVVASVAKTPQAPKISLFKKTSVEPKPSLTPVAQKVSSHAPMAPKVPEKPRNAFEIAWDKSAAGPNHTHPHNARQLKDIAHAEMQKAVSKAQSKSDYEALNSEYSRRMGMIKSLGHHYSETAPYDHIKKHIQDGHLEPDHVILDNMHKTTKREYALGSINKRTHDSRLRTLNKLSKVVHGTTTKPLIPGINPDIDSKYKSIRKIHGLLGKITRKTPIKVFSEQTMQKTLEIMNKKVI